MSMESRRKGPKSNSDLDAENVQAFTLAPGRVTRTSKLSAQDQVPTRTAGRPTPAA